MGDCDGGKHDRQEREQFLAGVHVGVLSVATADGASPLAVPVRYTYQPGGPVSVITPDGTWAPTAATCT
jgi:nitroimidazol reductase NimA-like FMN-containing flavoprotein (pyridoxamine 5'-phosphate oxidase superfamily)